MSRALPSPRETADPLNAMIEAWETLTRLVIECGGGTAIAARAERLFPKASPPAGSDHQIELANMLADLRHLESLRMSDETRARVRRLKSTIAKHLPKPTGGSHAAAA